MKTPPLLAIVCFLMLSCGPSPQERGVRDAYERFAAALASGDASALGPSFSSDASGEALRTLKEAVGGSHGFRVRFLDGSNAVVELSDPRRTLIPFTSSPDGSWAVSEQLERREFIKFLPAK